MFSSLWFPNVMKGVCWEERCVETRLLDEPETLGTGSGQGINQQVSSSRASPLALGNLFIHLGIIVSGVEDIYTMQNEKNMGSTVKP